LVFCESEILKSKLNSDFPSINILSNINNEDIHSFSFIYKIIKKEKPDVIHIHSNHSLYFILITKLLRIKKIVQTIHEWPYNEQENWTRKILYTIKFWLTIIITDKTILTNENDYNHALYFPFIRNNIQLVQNGIETPIFMSVEGAKQLLAKKVGMDLSLFKKKKIFGTISSLDENSGINYLIEASQMVIDKHKDIIFIIFGEGKNKNNLQELINKNGLEKNFYLLGYIDHAKEYIKAFDCFILPNTKHGLPYSVMEAGYASLPIISTTVGGIPDIIEDMKSGILIQPKKAKELAYAIFFTLEHIKDAKQYGKNLREKIINKFPIQSMIDNIYNIYNK
jgi:glycosyltransferase involved in cell wall biosynthesis